MRINPGLRQLLEETELSFSYTNLCSFGLFR